MQQSHETTPVQTEPPANPEDPDQMRLILERQLRTTRDESPRVLACRIANLRHRDGSRGTVQYDLHLQDAETGETWEQVVTGLVYGGDRTRRVWDMIQEIQGREATPSHAAKLAPFSYIPELDMLLQVFPHDHRLPALAMLMSGPPAWLIPNLLSDLAPGQWRIEHWQPEVVQYRADMRAIVRLDVRATDPEASRIDDRRIYAKVYRDADQASEAYRNLTALSAATRTGEPLPVVPRPIGHAAQFNTLVTNEVPGTSLARILRRGKAAESAVRSAARAIAAFHLLDIPAPLRPVNVEIAQLQAGAAHLAEARPDLATLVSTMVNAMSEALTGAPLGLIHGDLKPEHILVDEQRIGLLDFDLMASADPIIDVAHLIAFLSGPTERSANRGNDADQIANAFVDEYFRHAPESWRSRLRVYHAVTSLHKAVGLSRRGGERRLQMIEDVLREGQSYLDGRVGDTTAPTFKRRLTRLASQ